MGYLGSQEELPGIGHFSFSHFLRYWRWSQGWLNAFFQTISHEKTNCAPQNVWKGIQKWMAKLPVLGTKQPLLLLAVLSQLFLTLLHLLMHRTGPGLMGPHVHRVESGPSHRHFCCFSKNRWPPSVVIAWSPRGIVEACNHLVDSLETTFVPVNFSLEESTVHALQCATPTIHLFAFGHDQSMQVEVLTLKLGTSSLLRVVGTAPGSQWYPRRLQDFCH